MNSQLLPCHKTERNKTGRNTQSYRKRHKTTKRNFCQQLPVGGFASKAAGASSLAEELLKPHFVTLILRQFATPILGSQGFCFASQTEVLVRTWFSLRIRIAANLIPSPMIAIAEKSLRFQIAKSKIAKFCRRTRRKTARKSQRKSQHKFGCE